MATINPFDPRTILLAKHAQHVVLIHFPIALFITGVALDLFSRGKPGSPLAAAAYLNLSIAAATVLPTILTGLLAWQFALDGERLKGILLIHVIAACTAASLVIASWWVHWRTRKSLRTLPAYSMLVELLGVALIGLTAHLGGFITGVNS
jgi:uncharacterized membrane protein